MSDESLFSLGPPNIELDLSSPGGQNLDAAASGCPVCGRKGLPVQGQTVKALVDVSLREVLDGEYLFCRTETCPVVYYDAATGRTFETAQIRERVYQKAPELDDGLICYCFQHRVGEIRKGNAAAQSAIVEDINAGIRSGQCACDLRNPQGACCLGNVLRLIRLSRPSQDMAAT